MRLAWAEARTLRRRQQARSPTAACSPRRLLARRRQPLPISPHTSPWRKRHLELLSHLASRVVFRSHVRAR